MATDAQAPRIYFTAVDPLGQTVEVTKWRWAHAIKGHPAMLGQEQMVKDAIENPETIHEGNTAHDKVFKGYRIPGQGFNYGGMYPIVVVRYDARGLGDLRTAYLSARVPRAKVLWTHPQAAGLEAWKFSTTKKPTCSICPSGSQNHQA